MPAQSTCFTYHHPLIPYAVEHGYMYDSIATDEEAELLNAIYPAVVAGNQKAIKPLLAFTRRSPHVPQAQNHLFTLYMMGGKRRKAMSVLRELRKTHPDYLFGLTNEANLLVQDKKDTAAARRLMGESLLLQDLYPERKVFHLSEVVNYYQSCILLLLEEGNIEAAKERHGILLAIDPEHHITQGLTQRIATKEMLVKMLEMQERQRSKRIAKTRATAPYPQWKQAPVFHHPEIEAFYRYGWEDLPKADMSAIAALPQATLVQDLCRVLEDGLRRYRYFEQQSRGWKAWQDNQVGFMAHAFYFLGVFGDEACLPIVLDVMRQEEAFSDLWFGEMTSTLVYPYLARVAPGQMTALQQFMQERYVLCSFKIMVHNAVAQVAWHDRSRLPEVRDWFGSLFEYYALHLDDKALIDSDLIAWMVAAAGELSLQELLPQIELLYQKGVVSKDIIGDWAEIVELFEAPLDEANLEPLPLNIFEAYDDSYLERKKAQELSQEERDRLEKIDQDPYAQKMLELLTKAMGGKEDEMPMLTSSSPTVKPATASPKPITASSTKVGRNEPCPCQSGRKYKHCCGKK